MQIAYPWIFILILLPWLIRWGLPRTAQSHQAALKVPFFHQIKTQLNSDTSKRMQSHSKRRYLIFSIWGLLVIAGSGPQWLGQPIELPRTGRDILIAVDLSGSMRIPDMTLSGHEANRLSVVKHVASNFIGQRQGDRLGLVLFGTHAYLQTPLTFDRKTVQDMLDDASIGLAGMKTAIGDAIGLSIKQLIHFPRESRALILMTDGANNAGNSDPMQAARIAEAHGIKIYTIGLGADQMYVSTPFGTQFVNPSNDLDINLLQQIAATTGGEFFRANDVNALKRIYKKINALEPIQGDAVMLRPIKPLYPYPLAVALILALILALTFILRNKRSEP